MAERLHTMGLKGREFLIGKGWKRPLPLERRPPRSLEHFVGINDIRVAVERGAEEEGIGVAFFFACWELQQHGWAYPIIPDAVCRLGRSGKFATVLFEYDRGEESPGYVIRTKFKTYAEGLPGFPFSRVLVVTDTAERLNQLENRAKHYAMPELFSFIVLEVLRPSRNFGEMAFLDPLRDPLRRHNGLRAATAVIPTG
jgi:hypothetical protein